MNADSAAKVAPQSLLGGLRDDHPAIVGFVVLELAVVLLSVMTSILAGGQGGEQTLLNELAGLLFAVAIIYGVIGTIGFAIVLGVRLFTT
ncbi:hypothetical protein [Halorhabdus salina]|uniref:hypothetical protein n=1 Tax=Halorhabdus salina TaxID=2750670 RepID=UPI0015EE3F4C|nr:hypothetical protein [Halorhabdus salina]